MQAISKRAFWPAFIFLNLILIGGFVYAVLQQPALLTHTLPGTFGPDLSPAHTGNMLALALLLAANAVLILGFGIAGSKLRLLLGIVLLVLALPIFCLTYTQAAPTGTPLLEIAATPVANYDVDAITVLQFTGDQLAGALLLDAPEIFHWRFTSAETARGNTVFGIFIFLFRALIGLGVLVLLFAKWRSAKDPALAETAVAIAAVEAAEAHAGEAVHVEPAFEPTASDKHTPDEAEQEPAAETHNTPEQDEQVPAEQVPAEPVPEEPAPDAPAHDDNDKHAQTESEMAESEVTQAEDVTQTEADETKPAEAAHPAETEADHAPAAAEDIQAEHDHVEPVAEAQAEDHEPGEPGEPEKEPA